MSTSSMILLFDLIFAGGAALEATRLTMMRRREQQAIAPPVIATVRAAVINGVVRTSCSEVAIRVAPLQHPGVAIELRDVVGHTDVLSMRADEIRDLHVWLRGRSVPVLVGDGLPMVSAMLPLPADLAAWEIQIGTESGQILRCYGEDRSVAMEHDLARLRRLVAAQAYRSLALSGRPARAAAPAAAGPWLATLAPIPEGLSA